MQEMSENFNSLRPILFELCKKNFRGGQIDPPPAGIGLKYKQMLSFSIVIYFLLFTFQEEEDRMQFT